MSKQTLINWSKELEIEISNLKKIELESLQEKYFMLKAQRIELFGERLKAINDELKKRDLTEIPTDKLFDMLVKNFNLLKEESIDVIFQGTTPLIPDDFACKIKWQA